jgi:hypothetical protein
VLVRDTFDGPLPAELRRLTEAPSCAAADEPILLAGPWLGIQDADGNEVDLTSSYDVELFVERTSASRYERAFLTIRVPSGIEPPLTQSDIRSSLWEGGTIELSVACRDGRYVAESVAAHRPG